MKTLLCTIFILLSGFIRAQDCDPEALLLKPGNWKAGIKGSVSGVSAKDLIAERSFLAGIHQMISSACTPAGCRFLYSNSIGGAYPGEKRKWVADHFSYSVFVLPYLCDPDSKDGSGFYTAIATSTILNIDANVIWSLNNLYAASMEEGEFRGYLKLEKRPEWKDGYYLMNEKISDNTDPERSTVETNWLITYDQTLPFSYLSRKEYLLLTKKRLEKTMKEDKSSAGYYTTFMDKINNYLQGPSSELEQVAVCMWNDEERFNGFVDEGTPGSFLAVIPNLDYYHKGLARSVPQFFYVSFKVTHGYPVLTQNMDALQNAVDFGKLRRSLGTAPAAPVSNKQPQKPNTQVTHH